jgi:hypothetical protein
MTPKSATKKSLKNSTDMLRDLLITQLGLAGVPQAAIRDIVGGDIKRVNQIVRYIKPRKKSKR